MLYLSGSLEVIVLPSRVGGADSPVQLRWVLLTWNSARACAALLGMVLFFETKVEAAFLLYLYIQACGGSGTLMIFKSQLGSFSFIWRIAHIRSQVNLWYQLIKSKKSNSLASFFHTIYVLLRWLIKSSGYTQSFSFNCCSAIPFVFSSEHCQYG